MKRSGDAGSSSEQPLTKVTKTSGPEQISASTLDNNIKVAGPLPDAATYDGSITNFTTEVEDFFDAFSPDTSSFDQTQDLFGYLSWEFLFQDGASN